MKFLVLALAANDPRGEKIGELEFDSNKLTKENCLDLLSDQNLLPEIESFFRNLVARQLGGDDQAPSLPINWQNTQLSVGDWNMWSDGLETRPFQAVTLHLPNEEGVPTGHVLEIVPKATAMAARRASAG